MRPLNFVVALALVLAWACSESTDPVPTSPDASQSQSDAAPVADADVPAEERAPILFVHGINGELANFDVLIGRLIADGWSPDRLFAYTFDDPSWGCNVDNAESIDAWVTSILQSTGAAKIRIVAHSMGTLSSRRFIKVLGGSERVELYVTMGGMHHGLASSCSPDFPLKPCVWSELCESQEYIAELNTAPLTPGDFPWVSIYGTADSTVPNASSILEGAENISLEGVEHAGADGLLEHDDAYAELLRVLNY